MAGLLDFLQTPEAQLGIGLLAYSGDMGRPMGFGERIAGALGTVQRQQQAAEEKKLRAGLLQSQTAENQAQVAKLQRDAAEAERLQQFVFGGAGSGALAGGGTAVGVNPGVASMGAGAPQGGGFNLASMSPEQVMALERLGYKSAADLWKFGRTPQTVAANSFFQVGDSPMQYAPDPKSGIAYDPRTGQTALMPGFLPAQAALEGAREEAKLRANDPREFIEITNPDGSKGMISRAEAMRRTQPAGNTAGVGYTGQPMIDAVMYTESRGAPGAVSPAGARGTMQTMPGTLASPGFGVTPARDNTPQELQRVGVDYWNAMTQRYGDPALAAVAYNWGPGNADKWIADGADFRKLPKETQDYVGQVMLRNGINSTRGASGGGAIQTGLSSRQQAENEAQRERIVGQAKADVMPTDQKLSAFTTAQDAIGLIDRALAHPGRAVATGLSGTLDPRNYIPGTQARDFSVMLDQIKGGTFLQAFQSLKGGGAITEVEGRKAEQAIARLERAQSDGEFEAALKDYRAVLSRGMERARERAGIPADRPAPQQPATPTVFDTMPPAAQYKGRRIRGDDGRILQSDGMTWKEVR